MGYMENSDCMYSYYYDPLYDSHDYGVWCDGERVVDLQGDGDLGICN